MAPCANAKSAFISINANNLQLKIQIICHFYSLDINFKLNKLILDYYSRFDQILQIIRAY